MKFLQARQGIIDLQQWTVTIIAGALVEIKRRDVQVDHPARFTQTLTVFWIKHHTTARRHDNFRHDRKLSDGLRLTPPKTRFTFNFEDRRDRHTGPFDDFMIGIVERTMQATRQLFTDSGFAGPHQANQINVFANDF